MKTITQAAEYGCGPACVAMLCGVELPDALQHFARRHDWSRKGVGKIALKRAFDGFKYDMGRLEKVARNRQALASIDDDLLLWGPLLDYSGNPCWNTETHTADINIVAPAIRKVCQGEQIRANVSTFDHWAVWDGKAKALRDPYGYQSMFVPIYFHRITPR